mmetsp:Transcript_72521/g.216382  ORF Transcript_72521/g.216382 Transcript_72521/m.216382 type:complete len:210 (+) Transcript_72521:1561-2190(+)
MEATVRKLMPASFSSRPFSCSLNSARGGYSKAGSGAREAQSRRCSGCMATWAFVRSIRSSCFLASAPLTPEAPGLSSRACSSRQMSYSAIISCIPRCMARIVTASRRSVITPWSPAALAWHSVPLWARSRSTSSCSPKKRMSSLHSCAGGRSRRYRTVLSTTLRRSVLRSPNALWRRLRSRRLSFQRIVDSGRRTQRRQFMWQRHICAW